MRLVVALNGGGDVHWESVVISCRPCDYDGYDIVMHTSTVKQDSDEFAKFLGESDIAEMKDRYEQNLSVKTSTSDAEAYIKGQQEYYKQNVPKDVTMALYYGPYHWDFELFGFTYDDYLGEI